MIARWGWMGLLAVWMLAAVAAQAQLDEPGPIRLSHVEGYVFNSAGKPVANAEVTLARNEKIEMRTRTDSEGAFHFEKTSGSYLLRVGRTEYAPAVREVLVRQELVTQLERKKLYIVVGPGACMDECSSVLDSKKQFDQLIRMKNRPRE